jgi:hypothetical protein
MVSLDSARLRAMGVFALVLASFALSGCGALTDVFKELRDTAAPKAAFTDGIGEAPFNLATDCMPASQNDKRQCVLPSEATVNDNSTYHRISSLTNPVDQVLWRNRFQDFLIWRSEKQCQVYKSSIISTQNGVNFGLNALTTGAAGVAAIVIAPAANILGGIASISNGVRGHFNEDFYQRFVAPAIINQIDKQRGDQLVKVMLKRGVNVDSRPMITAEVSTTAPTVRTIASSVPAKMVLPQDYTLEEAIGDTERYHQLCSATVALATLLKDDTKFADTATGLKARLGVLTDQITANSTQIEKLRSQNNEDDASKTHPYTDTIKQLTDANADLAKQVAILQRQLLTAPASR